MQGQSPELTAPSTFGRFILTGAVGFAVDASVLMMLASGAHWPIEIARVLSFCAAVLVTWAMHRWWTFRHHVHGARSRHVAVQLTLYVAVQAVGACLNYMVFLAAAHALGRTTESLLPALACGSACGMVVNYAGSRLVVFRRRTA